MYLYITYNQPYVSNQLFCSKKSPTGPTERTPKPEYLIALAAYLGVCWYSVPFNVWWICCCWKLSDVPKYPWGLCQAWFDQIRFGGKAPLWHWCWSIHSLRCETAWKWRKGEGKMPHFLKALHKWFFEATYWDIKDFKCENWYMSIVFWNKMTCIWHQRPRICSQKIARKHVFGDLRLGPFLRQEKHLVTQSCVVWCLQLVVAINWAWMISVNLASKNFVTWTNRSSLLGKDMGSFRNHVEVSNSRKGPNGCSGCIGDEILPSLVGNYNKLGGGFKYCIFFIFPLTWGRFPIWRAYFSDGLVQPWTR